jgi:hypothetical protein
VRVIVMPNANRKYAAPAAAARARRYYMYRTLQQFMVTAYR